MATPKHFGLGLFSLFVFAFGLPAGVAAQINKVTCKAPNQPGALVVTVEAKQASPPGAPAGLHLVVTLPSSEDEIDIANANLKAAIKAWIDSQNTLAASERHDWILDGKNSANLFNSEDPRGLKKALVPGFTIQFVALAQPKLPSAAKQDRVNFCFASSAPPATVQSLELLISTAAYKALPASDARRLSLPLPSITAGVSAQALISTGDFASDVEKQQLLSALAQVAGNALDIARKDGLNLSGAAPDSVLRKVENDISSIYSMQSGTLPGFFSVWPNALTRIKYVPETNHFTLAVQGVTMAKSANIQVDLGITPGTGTGTAKAKKLALRTEKELNQRFSARLLALTNTVPTFAQIDSLSSEIALAPEIVPSAVPVSVENGKPHVIVFNTKNRWISFGFKLSGGGGYSVEQKATGDFTFEGDNLLLKIRDNLHDRPRETENFSYIGGNEVQKVNGAWAVDWTHDHESEAQTTYGVHFSGDYLQDNDQRFGNLLGPHLRDRERAVKGSLVYGFRSRPADGDGNPRKHSYGASAAIGVEYRHVNIDPQNGAVPPPLANGTLTDLFADLTLNYRYQALSLKRGGLGGLELSLVTRAIRGFARSDFPFTQISVAGQGTLFFGAKHARDFFLRFRQGIGTSNGRTPLFQLFRLGGADVLRGIEQGEFVGRQIGYQQFEAGVSVRQIASWFSHQSKSPAKPDEEAAKSPIDLSKIYLKGFYDRGRVFDNADFRDLFVVPHAARGYGFAVEVQALPAQSRSVTLSIGYARSPDSILHRKGLALTGVSINF
jgi:hypothetical protein